MKPRLRQVHRWLVWTFLVFSALFGAWAVNRHLTSPEPAALACGVGFLLVAAACAVYLRRSSYLKG